jgi:hypothetical protein
MKAEFGAGTTGEMTNNELISKAEPENKLDKPFVLGYVLVDESIHSRGKDQD